MNNKIYRAKSLPKVKRIAALDIGSHTTRMLVAEYTDSLNIFRVLDRKRTYTHLAEGFKGEGEGDLTEEAVNRTAKALKTFVASTGRLRVDEFCGVSTGVARRAKNKEFFIDSVKRISGLDIDIISGEREALLTRRGVIWGGGNINPDSQVIFDLGGATTEFIWGEEGDLGIKSLPIGALVLKQGYLESDPPTDDMLRVLSERIDSILHSGLSGEKWGLRNNRLIGSGGTASTLAAVIKRLGVKEISPGRINGLVLGLNDIENFINRIKSMPLSGRQRIKGMEKGRAEVIIAGTLAVSRIMHFFSSREMTASYSDILEGIIISYIWEEDNE
jgi:exopolyphosphatase / guanosine-5'-triphosphate,3'-diphosphate pyrophosphatase